MSGKTVKTRKVVSYLTLPVTLLFFAALIITFLYPEFLQKLNLTETEAWVIIMNLISLIFLLSFLQTHLSLPWRIFCLIASFLVLFESILMLGVLNVIFK